MRSNVCWLQMFWHRYLQKCEMRYGVCPPPRAGAGGEASERLAPAWQMAPEAPRSLYAHAEAVPGSGRRGGPLEGAPAVLCGPASPAKRWYPAGIEHLFYRCVNKHAQCQENPPG